MILAPFTLHRPESLAEALSLAAKLPDGGYDWIGGGTDLLQNYKNRLNAKDHVIALDRVPEMRGISAERIGAGERLAVISESAVVRERWPGLAEAITHVASPLIRNSGTLGGNLLVETRCYYFNQTPFWRGTKGSCMKAESDECLVVPQKEICYAAYSGDLAPILGVLSATLELASPAGTREVRIDEFYAGDGIRKNVKRADEIIVGVKVPAEASTLRAGYRKLRHRDALDYPEMGCAAALRLDPSGRIELLRAATTAVDVVPHFLDFSELMRGQEPDTAFAEVAAAMEERAQPKKNTSMPVGYRKKMVRVYLGRLLDDLRAGRTEGRIPAA
ncbi:MAG: FAD binding domain-containing protein [Gemmatimonadetes bacterium]|nr:FAD binding domain-containing protein [Gemmatimonadota bacterium]